MTETDKITNESHIATLLHTSDDPELADLIEAAATAAVADEDTATAEESAPLDPFANAESNDGPEAEADAAAAFVRDEDPADTTAAASLTDEQRDLLACLPDSVVAAPGLALEPATLRAMVLLRFESAAKWETLRAQLKINGVRVSVLDPLFKTTMERMVAERRRRTDEDADGGKPRIVVDRNRPDTSLMLLRGVFDSETCTQAALPGLPALPLLFNHLGRAVFIDSGEAKGAVGARLGHRTMKATATQLYGMVGHVAVTGYWKKEEGPDGEGVMEFVPRALPHEIAAAYLTGNWHNTLPRIEAITSTPIVTRNGDVIFTKGFHEAQAVLMEHCIDVVFSEDPSFEEAKAKLLQVRDFFKASAFADRKTEEAASSAGPLLVPPEDSGGDGPLFAAAVTPPAADVTAAPRLTDLLKPIGRDESAFLSSLLTPFVLRCGEKVPGHMFTAPAVTGSGTGKTAMAQAGAVIASGRPMNAIAADVPAEELEKRIFSAIAAGVEAVFLSNANDGGKCLATLERLITDFSNTGRLLGSSNMTRMPDALLAYAEGNGLAPGGDGNRRWVVCSMDTKLEFAGSVRHDGRFLVKVRRERPRLLSALLTILRWGAQGRAGGLPLPADRTPTANFAVWGEMVRDTLMALGCVDVFAGQQERGRVDPGRARQTAIFDAWEASFGGAVVAAHTLRTGAGGRCDELRGLLDLQRRPLSIANAAERLVGVTNGGRRIEKVDGVNRTVGGYIAYTETTRAWRMVDLAGEALPEVVHQVREQGVGEVPSGGDWGDSVPE